MYLYIYSLILTTNIYLVFMMWGSERNMVLYLTKLMTHGEKQMITQKFPKVMINAKISDGSSDNRAWPKHTNRNTQLRAGSNEESLPKKGWLSWGLLQAPQHVPFLFHGIYHTGIFLNNSFVDSWIHLFDLWNKYLLILTTQTKVPKVEFIISPFPILWHCYHWKRWSVFFYTLYCRTVLYFGNYISTMSFIVQLHSLP